MIQMFKLSTDDIIKSVIILLCFNSRPLVYLQGPLKKDTQKTMPGPLPEEA